MSDEKITRLFKVREGFFLHPVVGSELEKVTNGDAIPGGTEVELTEGEAAIYATQIELADPADIKAALAAEAKAAKAAANAAG